MLVGAVLCRNEAARYLRDVLENLSEFCDKVLVLDDGSTDSSVALARDCGAEVQRTSNKNPMWGDETPARIKLWDWAKEVAGDGWIYVADADHITHGGQVLRKLQLTWNLNAWALPLYDVWDESRVHYRDDGYWVGHRYPRIWMVCPSRVPEGWFAKWPGRGVHCGHFPPNFPVVGGIAPRDVYIEHLGYASEADRQARYERYMSVKNQLAPQELAHAKSILD